MNATSASGFLMVLAAGTRLGPYEIQSALGAGGMGEVYTAKDTRLDRIVAIKILSPTLAADPQFRERFDREARTISQLDHPHICALYDVGEQNGMAYLVMQYLEGETLADRLLKGALPLDQALKIGVDVADALDKAHRAGIIHRDLKPGNIFLTKDSAKLLDFGLAKAHAPSIAGTGASMLPTTPPVTAHGTILGTVQYMAPEQIEGQEADARTDIFAFGMVLYEMLTGRRAFEGKTQASLFGAILKDEPPLITRMQRLAPPVLDYVVGHCLAKNPDTRWQSARDISSELKWIADTSGSRAASSLAAATDSVGARLVVRWPRAWLAATAFLLFLSASAMFVLLRATQPMPGTVRFEVTLPQKAARPGLAATTFGLYDVPAVSPDGRRLAFTASTADGKWVLWVRSLDAVTSQPLPGTDEAHLPFWSPDGRTIAFFAQGKLKKVDAVEGPVQTLADVENAAGGTWNRNGVILFSPGANQPIRRVSADGGEVTPVTTLDASLQETDHLWPHFLSDGRHFLYATLGAPQDRAICVGSLDKKEITRLPLPFGNASYAGGYLLFLRGDTLMAQPFDRKKLELSGEPISIANHIGLIPLGFLPGALFSVSDTGVLAYRTGAPARTQLVWLDRRGQRVGSIGEPADYSNPALSPDETKVAVGIRDPQTRTRDIWTFDLTNGTSSRLTFDPADDLNPIWSPDGTEIAFTSDRKGIRNLYRKPASGASQEELLFESHDNKNVEDWSRDGRFIVFNLGSPKPGHGYDLWALSLADDHKPFPVVEDPFMQQYARVSPNGHWIAYGSLESGRYEVFVRPFAPGGAGRSGAVSEAAGKWQVSTNGGTEPAWRADGKELFYLADPKLMVVDVNTDGATFEAGIPKPLFEATLSTRNRNRYVVAANGQRFLFSTVVDEGAASPITVVLNWDAALKK